MAQERKSIQPITPDDAEKVTGGTANAQEHKCDKCTWSGCTCICSTCNCTCDTQSHSHVS